MGHCSTAFAHPLTVSPLLTARVQKHVVQAFGEARAATAHSSFAIEFRRNDSTAQECTYQAFR